MTITAQSPRGTVTENTNRSRWRCPECKSENVQVALPVWFREYQDGELRQVNVDEEADPLWWSCDDCGEGDEHEPDRTEDAVVPISIGKGA